jgi:putative adenylate-forming enzyme
MRKAAVFDQLAILKHWFGARYRYRFRNRSALEAHQSKAIAKFRSSVLSRSPWYRQFADVKFDDLPIIDKTIMMEHFDQINTRGITAKKAFEVALAAEKSRDFTDTLGDVTAGLSTGTSGSRGLFLASTRERRKWAGMMMARLLQQPLWHRQSIAFFLRANSNLYETVSNKARISFSFYDLCTALPDHMERLNEQRPSILIAPAQVLGLLAQEQLQHRLEISPRLIYSVAEVLDASDRQVIEEAFPGRLGEIYQCTEGVLAMTCGHGSLHLNEEYVFFEKEWLDRDSGRFTPIVTDFSRETMPIVRYRMNDILVEDNRPCPCGNVTTRISRIEGRCDDILKYRKLNGETTHIMPDMITRSVVVAHESITDYRIIQKSPSTLTVMLESEQVQEARDAVTERLREFFNSLACQMPDLLFEDFRQVDLTVKRRRVIRQEFPC